MTATTAALPFGGTDTLSKLAWGTLLVLCGALFLDALDISMMGVALPSIRADLNMSTSSLQWVVSAYVLGYGGFVLLGGRAADLLGRRRVFVVALAVFVVASILRGFANDGTLLIAARFVKGVSAAFSAPAALSIITTTFAESAARNKAFAVVAATGATGFSLGLVLGGALTEIGWRWVFFLPAPVALATLLGGLWLVPRDRVERGVSRAVDVAGAVSMTAAMLLLVFTLVEAPSAGWTSLRTLGSFITVAVILAAFVAREHTAAEPAPDRIAIGAAGDERLAVAKVTRLLDRLGFDPVDAGPLKNGLTLEPDGSPIAITYSADQLAKLVSRSTRSTAVDLASSRPTGGAETLASTSSLLRLGDVREHAAKDDGVGVGTERSWSGLADVVSVRAMWFVADRSRAR